MCRTVTDYPQLPLYPHKMSIPIDGLKKTMNKYLDIQKPGRN